VPPRTTNSSPRLETTFSFLDSQGDDVDAVIQEVAVRIGQAEDQRPAFGGRGRIGGIASRRGHRLARYCGRCAATAYADCGGRFPFVVVREQAKNT